MGDLTPDLRRERLRGGFVAERRVLYGDVVVALRKVVDRYALEYDMALMETVGCLASLQHQLLRDGWAAVEASEEDDE